MWRVQGIRKQLHSVLCNNDAGGDTGRPEGVQGLRDWQERRKLIDQFCERFVDVEEEERLAAEQQADYERGVRLAKAMHMQQQGTPKPRGQDSA